MFEEEVKSLEANKMFEAPPEEEKKLELYPNASDIPAPIEQPHIQEAEIIETKTQDIIPKDELLKSIFDFFLGVLESSDLEQQKGNAIRQQDFAKATELTQKQMEIGKNMPKIEYLKVLRSQL